MFSSTTLKVKSDPTVHRRSTEPRIEFANQQRDHQRLQCNHLFLLINKSDGVSGTYLIHLGLLTFKLSLWSISMKQLCLLRLPIKVTGKAIFLLDAVMMGSMVICKKKLLAISAKHATPRQDTARWMVMWKTVSRNNNSEIIWFHRLYSKAYRTMDITEPKIGIKTRYRNIYNYRRVYGYYRTIERPKNIGATSPLTGI